ncbi:hypothetical protein F8388_022899 [Cannabis sativa]|uniref:RNase H type-1 domain-containing protein n=1 Tax=Cannabis sativa TaxID=3483 RepID=A0A7J6FEW4_CANSA|nr:hypothetical protein F8388_022899 [Cannabis sativa]
MLNNSDRPWVSILRDKYCKNLSFWNVEANRGDSMVWKGMLNGHDVVVSGAGLIVGRGNSDMWLTPWVPGFSPEVVRDSFTYAFTHSFSVVADLFKPNSYVWDENVIWRSRNDLRIKGHKPNVLEISCRTLKRAQEFMKVRVKDQTVVSENSCSEDRGHLNHFKWDGHFQVDASVKDGEAGTGVLQCGIGEDAATVLLSYSEGMTVLEAELNAILQALRFALQEGYETILIESDSAIAVKALRNKELPT